jgi:outer membrane protein OmpA-like peptidoglycan-associated protein
MNKGTRIIFLLLMCMVIYGHVNKAIAEPVAQSAVSINSGWTGLPSFVKQAIKTTDSTYNLEGYTVGISYISYGRKGPNGVFSTKWSFTYNHYRSLPNVSKFTAQNADMFMLDVAELLTILPTKPVNLYTGIGMGWGVLKVYHWGIPIDSTVAQKEVDDLKKSIDKLYLPFPVIYIPIGLNVKIKDFILSAETGVRDVPYLVGMVTYTFNKKDEIKIVKKFIPLPPEPVYTCKIKGRVIDKQTSSPIGRAIVELPDTGITDLSTNPMDGSFVIPDLKPGVIRLNVYKDGFISQSITITAQAGTTVTTVIALEKESTIGAISGKVTNLQGNPLSATVSVAYIGAQAGFTQAAQQLTCDPVSGTFFAKLPADDYVISASMQGYKTQTKQIHVNKGFKTIIDFILEPVSEPMQPILPPVIKKQRVFIEKEKKKIVITEKIFFQLGKSKIMPVSYSILDELAELLIKNPDITIRIEGYTDNIGKPAANLKLSQARAEAVMNYLAQRGVASNRMTAKGYGMANPIADNKTAKGRAENRRVEFVITSQ